MNRDKRLISVDSVLAWNASRCVRPRGERCDRSGNGATTERTSRFHIVTLCDLPASSGGHGQAGHGGRPAGSEDRFDCRGSSLIASVCHRIAPRPPSLFDDTANRHRQRQELDRSPSLSHVVATFSPALDCANIMYRWNEECLRVNGSWQQRRNDVVLLNHGEVTRRSALPCHDALMSLLWPTC